MFLQVLVYQRQLNMGVFFSCSLPIYTGSLTESEVRVIDWTSLPVSLEQPVSNPVLGLQAYTYTLIFFLFLYVCV